MDRKAGTSKVFKHKQGKPLKSGQKEMILYCFNKLSEKCPNAKVKSIEKDVSDLLGVSATSVHSVRNEFKDTGILKTPGKKRKSVQRVEKYDDFTLSVVRKKVHEFFLKNEPPTLNKVLESVNADPDLPDFSRSTLHRLMTDIGFEFKARKRNIIMDREDIVLWRRKYLRQIKALRNSGRKIYYLDETWLNEGYATTKAWSDTQVKSKKQAFLSGLSEGLKQPTGKGRRLIITHIGSDTGFVDGGLFVFESKTTREYHEEMTGEVFLEWFISVLPKLNPNSIIVMDNASYHSVKAERVPVMAWRKDAIIGWLRGHNVEFHDDMIKRELIDVVDSVRTHYDRYKVDETAEKAGFSVVRLPPYHCNLNPIELIWSQVKGFVRRNNRTFKLAEIRELLQTAVQNVTPTDWFNCVQHVVKEENLLWKVDGMADAVVDRLVITDSSSSDPTDSSEGSLSGVEILQESD